MAEPVPSKEASPPGSPALSASPSLSSDTPSLSPSFSAWTNRSLSNVSPVASEISRSSPQRSCSLPTVPTRRRGYIRPQGARFAPSAQNRDSVLSLGSIAHLQYYFARTGLLTGKGGRPAKVKQNGEYDFTPPSQFSLSRAGSDTGNGAIDSPIEEEGQLMWEAVQENGEEIMLPPTVSTYAHREPHVPPPPDHKGLKKGLVGALENALHALESVEPPVRRENSNQKLGDEGSGFDEIQGLHILDTTTLAIKAARLYYTLHPNPSLLNVIKPDFQIRKDLMAVMDVLKKYVSRKFAGGLREDERLAILVWVSDVGVMIDKEARMEEAERQQREGWQWINESLWPGREKEREVCFLESLLKSAPDQPTDHEWTQWEEILPTAEEPTGLLLALSDGRKLVHMHNTAVRRSKRHFGEIKDWHYDVAKPYRRAENLRFWLKAAEIRWEMKLSLNVMGVATASKGVGVWRQFEDTLLEWGKGVREEITQDWRNEEDKRLHARAKSLALASPAGSPKKGRPVREGEIRTFQKGISIPSHHDRS